VLRTVSNSAGSAANVPPTIVFENVCVELGGVHILDNVSASVPHGSCTAIVGPNGSGKTTLLLALLGQVHYKGEIKTTSATLGAGPLPRLGYVPQHLDFDRGLPLTVREFMVMGQQRLPLWFGCRAQHLQRAQALLTAVRADNLASRRLGALSGGEMQRVLLALALQQQPELLILDEPAAGVDFQGELLFCEILEELRREHGFTQLMVSHDLATVMHHATHVICLNRKVAAQGPPAEVLTQRNLAAIFGMHMGLANSPAISEHDPDSVASCGCCCSSGSGDSNGGATDA